MCSNAPSTPSMQAVGSHASGSATSAIGGAVPDTSGKLLPHMLADHRVVIPCLSASVQKDVAARRSGVGKQLTAMQRKSIGLWLEWLAAPDFNYWDCDCTRAVITKVKQGRPGGLTWARTLCATQATRSGNDWAREHSFRALRALLDIEWWCEKQLWVSSTQELCCDRRFPGCFRPPFVVHLQLSSFYH